MWLYHRSVFFLANLSGLLHCHRGNYWIASATLVTIKYIDKSPVSITWPLRYLLPTAIGLLVYAYNKDTIKGLHYRPFMWETPGDHWLDSPHKWPVMWKVLAWQDVIMKMQHNSKEETTPGCFMMTSWQKWFLCYWPFMRGIHWLPMDSLTRVSHVGFRVFFDVSLNKRLKKTLVKWPVIWDAFSLTDYDRNHWNVQCFAHLQLIQVMEFRTQLDSEIWS